MGDILSYILRPMEEKSSLSGPRHARASITMHEILVNAEKCTGCRACEIACSFHHNRNFSRKNTSIEIQRDEEKGKMKIIIRKSNEENNMPCDGCVGEKTPLCVTYCATKALDIV